MNNRLLEYESPSNEELVARLLLSLHKALDENFPNSGKSIDGNRRFSRTEFSTVSEDTIIEKNPGPATGEAVLNSKEFDIQVPPPPKPAQRAQNPTPFDSPSVSFAPVSAASRTGRFKIDETKPKTETSLELPEGITSVSRPLSRTHVAATGSNINGITGVTTSARKVGVNLKLFTFLFAILLGVAMGSVIFLFWYR